ncbi:hypothetical protein RF55_12669 [Lasius niger]|uniref:Uncharacterized protein n=1 Tax=Lasius niger TaxID=67767 RepID=A0A0J7KC84_LASNI|nr:hypothetical protein RF55_12669 [Lasius niger]
MDAAPELSSATHSVPGTTLFQGTVKITTRSLQLPVRYSTNEVILPSGARCHVTDGECNDADGITTYWSVLPIDSCQFNRYCTRDQLIGLPQLLHKRKRPPSTL